jgi:hypothetical protein
VATIFLSYTTLLLEVLAIVGGAVVLVTLVPTIPRAVAVPTIVALLVTVLAVYQLYVSSASMDSVRTQLALAPGITAREECLLEGGHSELIPFARWLNARIPPDAKVGFVAKSFDHPCFQFALLPRRMVADPSQARYVFYLDPPSAADRDRLAAEYRKPEADRTLQFYQRTWALEDKG